MADAKPHPARRFGCGAIFLLVVIAVVVIGIIGTTHKSGPCDEAHDAHVLAISGSSAHDREIAALEYAAKKAECESQGGTVDE